MTTLGQRKPLLKWKYHCTTDRLFILFGFSVFDYAKFATAFVTCFVKSTRVKQEVRCTVILPPLVCSLIERFVLVGQVFLNIWRFFWKKISMCYIICLIYLVTLGYYDFNLVYFCLNNRPHFVHYDLNKGYFCLIYQWPIL